MKTSLLLGAGFSKWAANLPIGNELFDYNIQVHTEAEKRKLNTIMNIKQNWDHQKPNHNVEEFIEYSMKLDQKQKKIVIWYIVRRLSDNFVWFGRTGRKYTYMIDEKVRSNHPGITKSIAFFKFIKSLDVQISGIVTTNYDLLIEYGLTSRGFNYGVVGQQLLGRGSAPTVLWNKRMRSGIGRVELVGEIRLAKIHGSLNNLIYTDSRNGLKGNAIIIPPIHEKKQSPLFAHQWKLASSILKSSEKLIVFGFGFNNYDEEVMNFLRLAGRTFNSVYVIDIVDKTQEIAKLWSHCKIEYIKSPTDTNFITWTKDFREKFESNSRK